MTERMVPTGMGGRGVGALIASLVRYPELSSLDFHPEAGRVTLSFCLRGSLSRERAETLADALMEVLLTYHHLLRFPLAGEGVAEFSTESQEPLTILRLTRDIHSLSPDEVGMVIDLLRDQCGAELLTDPNDFSEDDLLDQEETIQAALDSLAQEPGRRLFALREEGRVLVFNT
jgi:hypothetical protein